MVARGGLTQSLVDHAAGNHAIRQATKMKATNQQQHTRNLQRLFHRTAPATENRARHLRVPPEFTCALQRTEEVQQILFLRGGQRIEIRDYAISFRAVAGMLRDCRQQVAGAAIMQEENALAESPQWRGTELISACAALADIVI